MRLLLLLLLLPLVHAEPQLSAVEHNITYLLGEEKIVVKESIILKNSPFSVTTPVYYRLTPGAENIAVETGGGATYEVDETYGGVIFSFRNAYSTRVKIKLSYSYTTTNLRRSDGSYLFEGEALKRAYPWGIRVVHLRFVVPPSFSFGEVLPQPAEIGERELLYRITYLQPEAYQGFPVRIEYANYAELADRSLSIARAREQETFLAVREANLSILNAYSYEANLSAAEASFSRALEHLQEYFTLRQEAEALLEENSYLAYKKARAAVEQLELAGIRAREAQSSARLAVQMALERKLGSLEENLSQLGEAREERVVVVERQSDSQIYKYAFFGLAAIFALFVVSELRRILVPRSYRRRSSVGDFRVIGDLKRRSFEGFEKKVARVKRGVDIAREIRELRRREEKLRLGIENLRKKLIQGEIGEETYLAEKERFEGEIRDVEGRIAELERELSRVKRKHETG